MFFGLRMSASFVSQPVTVTGELPTYPAVDGQVDVTLVDMAIEMPDTITAGPHVWQVTNTGAMPHFMWIMNPGGPVTQEDAVNGVMLFYEMAECDTGRGRARSRIPAPGPSLAAPTPSPMA